MQEEIDLSFEELTFGDSKNDAVTASPKVDNNADNFQEDDKNAILVTTSYGSTINTTALLIIAEKLCGKIINQNFREGQSFGFIQFDDEKALEQALKHLQNLEMDGATIVVEKIDKVTPGRDPRTHNSNSEFKNTTLVFKNLPFQLKQDKFEEILVSANVPFISCSYVYDEKGMFKGMAFVKYKEIDTATKAFNALNNYDITGRKLRIEYKRKVKEAAVPDNDDGKAVLDQMNSFKANSTMAELAFPASSSFQRKQIHQFAEKFGFSHYTTSTSADNSSYVIVKKKDKKDGSGDEMVYSSSPKGIQGQPIAVKAVQQQSSGSRRNSLSKTENPKFSFGQSPKMPSSSPLNAPSSALSKSWQKDKDSALSAPQNSLGKSPPTSSLGTSPLKKTILGGFRPVSEEPPVRQPKGPDGTTGFSDEYRKRRNSLKGNSPSPNVSLINA